MRNHQPEITEMLRREVSDKLHLPSFAFGSIALFLFFTTLGCVENAAIIRVATATIVLLSILRYRLYLHFKKQPRVENSDWNYLLFLGWGNSIGWSVAFTAATIELQFSGPHYMVVLGLICGFVSASLITLSADLMMFFSFVCLLIGPQIVLTAQDFLSGNPHTVGGLLVVFTVYLAYEIKQVFEVRSRLVENFTQKLELRESNDELKRSYLAQKEQGLKLVHTSRLASIGEMAASISHEVNNPLSVISGGLQILKPRLTDQSLEHKELLLDNLNRSLKSIDRIQKITDGLQLLSRQSDGGAKEQVSLQTLMDDTVIFCTEILKSRSIELTVDSVPAARLWCHPVQVSQVLINLIKNAADALLEEVNPSERWIRIEFQTTSQLLTLKVINGGAKIPPPVQKQLFRPYFTTKEHGKGTGLGLSISREILHDHDGSLSFLVDAPNTTFVVELPLLQIN
jgi:C4-dicarboxylate-specific signal transduction histidine kinase